ncbi:interferon alpha-inducible protein 27-like protein 2B [Mytilus californianus]|uniref:interferon alpha-inducible protein 27-like protein 2B n=1 Tax=Mytilus californianus TaxID=6549 RepID=UPI0022463642|nr:interferon alpha-inducible protein 27-like protein 2B [Mytilus californianus]
MYLLFFSIEYIQRPLYIKPTMEQKYITVCVLFVLFVTPVQGDDESTDNEEWTSDDIWCITKKYGGAAILGAGTVALAPVALGAAGFTGAGIAAGSLAAKAMAAKAVANGGGVVAGGVVATL